MRQLGLKAYRQAKVFHLPQVSFAVDDEPRGVLEENLRKIIFGSAVAEAGDECILECVGEFRIPGILWPVKRIAGLVGVFVNYKNKRIQGIKCRTIQASYSG